MTDTIPNPPACNAEGFRITGYGDGSFLHARKRARADMGSAVVDEILVDFIGKDKKIMAPGKVCDPLEFNSAENLPRGIGGCVHHDPSGPGCNGLFQILGRK